MRKLFLIITFLFSIGVSPAFALTLFEEAFDGPDLPTTLTYISSPNFTRWYIDSSNRLYADRFQPAISHPRPVFAALSTSGFTLNDDGILYSADMGRPTVSVNPETNTVPGGSNIGLIFGGYRVLFHPGFPKDTGGDPGAFRIEEWQTGGEPLTLVNNTNMGFIPALDYLHHIEVFVTIQGNDLNMDISISGLGTDSLMHTFNYSYLGSPSVLGVGRIGVSRQGSNKDDAFFDNLMVEGTGALIHPVPITLNITEAQVKFNYKPNYDKFKIKGKFVLGEGNNGIDPIIEDVIVNVGTSSLVIPAPYSFVEEKAGVFKYKGIINSTDVEIEIKTKDYVTYNFKVKVKGTDLTNTANPVDVEIIIGNDIGNTNIKLKGLLNSKKTKRS